MKKAFLAVLFIFFIVGSILSIYQSYKNENALVFIGIPPKENGILNKIVYISGEVKNPGTFEISENARVSEVISLAGGFSENANASFITETLNLAKIVEDGEHIFIPSQNSITQNSNLISLNSASITELESLPGIGESTAQKIIDNRPYSSIEEIMNIGGIGESKFSQIKDLITL